MTQFCFFPETSAHNPRRTIEHYDQVLFFLVKVQHTTRVGVLHGGGFSNSTRRLGLKSIEFKSLVPRMFLPSFLKDTLGYQTHAMVSLPVLNPRTVLNSGWDSYKL